MRPFLVGATLLVTSITANSLGREVGFQELMSAYQEQVSWVSTCGTWRANELNGFYRVVHASLNGQSFLYVQWMTTNSEGINAAVATLSIPELNNDHAEVDLSNLRCVATKTGVVVLAKAYFSHAAKEGSVKVSVFHEPGKYRLEQRAP